MEEEIKEVNPELNANKELKTLTKPNPIAALGEYGIKGGPGRPPGLRNRYNQKMIDDISDVWEEENGKEIYRKLLRGSKSDQIVAINMRLSIIPKEARLELASPPIITQMPTVTINGKERTYNLGAHAVVRNGIKTKG